MKRIIFLAVVLITSITLGQVSKKNRKIVTSFISCIKQHKKEELAAAVVYPLARKYPLSEIKDQDEFIAQYDELFDAVLIKKIVQSKPSKNWNEVGWRGIMLNSGDLWLDYDGKIIAVNYLSASAQQKRHLLIENERSELYPSITGYKEPVCLLETKEFRIRIDDMGAGNYRYCSWATSKSMADKPDLVLKKGEFVSEGTGGNHRYVFQNGEDRYECSIIIMGETDAPPAQLTVYKKDEEILSQAAIIIKR